MSATQPTVFVVHDDISVRESLKLLHRVGRLAIGDSLLRGHECWRVQDDGCAYLGRMMTATSLMTQIASNAIGHSQGEAMTQRLLSDDALCKARCELAHIARVMSLGALTASVAHEVRQPLTGIITNASTCLRMLTGDHPDIDGARETARRTLRDGRRASEVITRLRALFTKREPKNEPMDLNEAIQEVIALSCCELQRDAVVLQLELADDLPLVTGDRVQLQQVILNLLLNASDAMKGVHDHPRQLVVRTERHEGDRVRVSVQDAGIGLGSHGLDELFEPFSTTKSEGMGIGLFVSRSIIDSHHGRLWGASNDGPGATFSFSIPGLVQPFSNTACPHQED